MAQERKKLRGIAWNHTRGFVPMVATAQRFHELHPEIEIVWEKRSLKEFGEFPVHKLIDQFDLLVIDHPYIGFAAKYQVFHPLNSHIEKTFLDDLQKNSVGKSYDSYVWDEKLWALPIDAATPVAAWRPDLLEKQKRNLPQNDQELFEFARQGLVDVSMEDINALMNFYMACQVEGEIPFLSRERMVSEECGVRALSFLKEMVRICDPEKRQHNPIQSLNFISSKENQKVVYALFPYGYVNYSQRGYSDFPLVFGDLPTFGGKPLVTTLGGRDWRFLQKLKTFRFVWSTRSSWLPVMFRKQSIPKWGDNRRIARRGRMRKTTESHVTLFKILSPSLIALLFGLVTRATTSFKSMRAP